MGGFEYYKSMGGTTKSGEDQIFKVQQGEARRGWEHNCSLKFSGEKPRRKLCYCGIIKTEEDN